MTTDAIIGVVINTITILGAIGLAHNRITNRLAILETKVQGLTEELHENGFARKEVVEELTKAAEQTHQYLQDQIDAVKCGASKRRKR